MKKEIIIIVEIDPNKIHLEEEIEDKIAEAARFASLDFLDIHGVTGSWFEEILTTKEDSEAQKPTKDNLDLTFQVTIKCHKDFVDIVDNAARLQFGVFSHNISTISGVSVVSVEDKKSDDAKFEDIQRKIKTFQNWMRETIDAYYTAARKYRGLSMDASTRITLNSIEHIQRYFNQLLNEKNNGA